jgi:hypothetical protein
MEKMPHNLKLYYAALRDKERLFHKKYALSYVGMYAEKAGSFNLFIKPTRAQ